MSNKKLVLAYSGGLDTTYCAIYLAKELGYEVYAILVNTGGFESDEIIQIENRALSLGIKEFKCANVSYKYYDKVIKYLIYGNILKNNTYPLSVSSERIIQALEIVKYCKAVGANYIAHGSTAAGNDQIRFDLIFNSLLPNVKIITPIRELKLSRESEIEYLKFHNVNYEFEKSIYSINKGLWGTSIGGKETLNSLGYLPEEAFPNQVTKTESERIEIEFSKGEPIGLNGNKYKNSVDLIKDLEKLSAGFGIGRDIHVGDTIIGIKGRVGFEASAPLLIIKAHHLLEKHTLSKSQLFWKETIANFYGNNLHEGLYLDPVMRDIEAMLESSQRYVNGKIHINLFPYRFELLGIVSDNDLMSSKYGSYGEKNNTWTYEDILGFTKIYGNSQNIFQQINNLND